jgi:hypothetical protein
MATVKNVTPIKKNTILKAKPSDVPAIIRAFIAGERSDKAIHAVLCVCAEQVSKDKNTIALLKQVVIPVLGYEAKPGSLDRKQITLNYIRDVMLLDVDKDALSVKFRFPADQYNREWFDKVKATPWGSTVKVTKEWTDQFDSWIGQSATGILMGSITWAQLKARFAPEVLASIGAEINKAKIQAKVKTRLEKLGHESFDIQAINLSYLDTVKGSVMAQA